MGSPAGVRLCSHVIVNLKTIPDGTTRILFGSIEKPQPDGSIVGITSQVMTSAGIIPSLDLAAVGSPGTN